MLSVIHLACAE